MAKSDNLSNKTVSNNTNAINKNTKASSSLEGNISDLNESIGSLNDAITDLGEGLKLTEKKETKKDDSRENKEDPTEKGVKNIIELLKESGSMLGGLLENQRKITEAEENPGGVVDLGENEEVDEFDEFFTTPLDKIDLDESGTEVSGLSKASNLPSLVASGFGVTTNKLSGILKDILKTLSDKGAGNPAGGQAEISAGEIKKETKDEEDSGSPGKTFTQYLNELAGPLESIATGVVLLSVAVGILSLIQPTAAALASVTFLVGLMGALIFGLTKIESMYNANPPKSLKVDENGQLVEEEGSIVGMIKAFSQLFMTMAITFMIVSVFHEIIWDGFGKSIGLLTSVVLITVATIFLLELSSAAVNKILGEGGKNSNIVQMVKGVTNLIATIVILSLVCYFFGKEIDAGLKSAMMIAGATMAMIVVFTAVISRTIKNLKPEALDAFANIVKQITVLVAVVAILTIVLGIIPQEIISQGLMNMALIAGLITGMLFMLTKCIKDLSKVPEKQLHDLVGLMIAVTVLILLTSIVVIVLAQQDPAALMMALFTMSLIISIPIIAIKVLSKLDTAKVPQALLATILASLLIVAIAGVMWVTSLILGPAIANFGGVDNMIGAAIAVAIFTLVIISVAFAGMVLGTLANGASLTLMGLALLTLGIASLLVVAIAGVMLLVSYILKPAIANFGGAEEMLLAVKALGLMVILIVTVAVTSIVLAGLFIPLMFSVSLAIASISLVVVFIEALAGVMGNLSASLESMSDIDSEGIQEFTKFMIEFTSSMILLVTPLISFNLVSWTLAGLLFTASIGLWAMVGSVWLTTRGLKALNNASKGATTPNLEPLSEAIKSLNEFSKSVNSFKGPKFGKMWSVMSAMNFAETFAKRLGKITDDGSAKKIETLANSLSKLADTSGGLKQVANALRDIQKATSELNAENLSALEKISGPNANANVNGNSIEEAIKASESKKEERKVDHTPEMLSLLKDILSSLQEMKNSMDKTASQAVSDSITSNFGKLDS